MRVSFFNLLWKLHQSTKKVSTIKRQFNFFIAFLRDNFSAKPISASDEIFSCTLVCHTVRRGQGGAIGIGNRHLVGDGRAGLETHVERGEQNGTRRNKKSGVEDTRAIHNARTSAKMRPTDKYNGKWRNKKERWKSETIRRRDCVYVMLPPRVLRVQGSLFLDYKINTEHCYKLIFLPEKNSKILLTTR